MRSTLLVSSSGSKRALSKRNQRRRVRALIKCKQEEVVQIIVGRMQEEVIRILMGYEQGEKMSLKYWWRNADPFGKKIVQWFGILAVLAVVVSAIRCGV